jgi:hypothetical protein
MHYHPSYPRIRAHTKERGTQAYTLWLLGEGGGESGKPLTGNNERSLSSKRPGRDRSGVTGEYREGIGFGNLPAVFCRYLGKRASFVPLPTPVKSPSLPVSSYALKGSLEGYRHTPIGSAETPDASRRRSCSGDTLLLPQAPLQNQQILLRVCRRGERRDVSHCWAPATSITGEEVHMSPCGILYGQRALSMSRVATARH